MRKKAAGPDDNRPDPTTRLPEVAQYRSASTSDEALVGALANYLSDTRDRDDIRHAIARWRHDVENAGHQPERVIISFKKILVGLAPAQQSADYFVRLEDKRDMILMCIEEYFTAALEPPE